MASPLMDRRTTLSFSRTKIFLTFFQRLLVGLRIFGPDVIARLDVLDGLEAVLRVDLGPCGEAADSSSCGFLKLLDSLGIPHRRFRLYLSPWCFSSSPQYVSAWPWPSSSPSLPCMLPGFLGILDRLVGLVSRPRYLEYLERVHYT